MRNDTFLAPLGMSPGSVHVRYDLVSPVFLAGSHVASSHFHGEFLTFFESLITMRISSIVVVPK